ncbi:TPA: hypothetical protein ACYU8D_004737 [Klebsiella pneumoniae]|nr:hypothetical protein [Klebsiella pneumoniae]HAJ5766504.1 hypothetical protein [Escherichia coli]EIW8782022.1 hypothetical protein [Klebsiella pneumoniae]EKU3922252.1 hypothetical protein [Klebsiella pneumoniae]EKW2134958.1 hypothetical protein [Klebsiella pneumoniae]KAB1794676.1 hypothetical protein FXO02_02610 [Klebsiella pneumoniae]
MVNEIDAVVTRVIECWPIHDLWMVEVEVMAGGEYLRTDITVSTKREACAIQPGDTVAIPVVGQDGDFADEDELPF